MHQANTFFLCSTTQWLIAPLPLMQHTAEYVLYGICNCIVFAVLGHVHLRFSYDNGKLQYQSVQPLHEAICKLEHTQESTT